MAELAIGLPPTPDRSESVELQVRPGYEIIGNYPEGTIGHLLFPDVLKGRQRAKPAVERALQREILHTGNLGRQTQLRNYLKENSIQSLGDLFSHPIDTRNQNIIRGSNAITEAVTQRLTWDLLITPQVQYAIEIVGQLGNTPILNTEDEETIHTLIENYIATLPSDISSVTTFYRGFDRGYGRTNDEIKSDKTYAKVTQNTKLLFQGINRLRANAELMSQLRELIPQQSPVEPSS